ncbi:radical SAM protein [Mastigocoleus testarum]|uniref:Radical SAM core domain-containing protein n=1 Tax=Mastigocoleus testarum BC008 TaxID=371196 RepID=A0A0V7ZSB3_9CYAN|nr:radical SAM/SPASM domain-containing protein [Mastigocoleus testarum]KST67358.1 hypothetical protein BC008_29625 [Mastigocoleus testarum BC008]
MTIGINNQNFRGSIDFCIFFPDVENIKGTIYIQGWLYDKKFTRQLPLIEIESNNNIIASFLCDIERLDVKNHFKDAPLKSGFMAYIPVADTSCLSAPLNIYYKSGNNKFKVADTYIFNIDEFLKDPHLLNKLTFRQKEKLNNLILNEKERIHKVSSLKSKPLYLIIDPSFSCQLKCPYCHGNMVREAGVSLPMMQENTVDSVLAKYGETLIQAHFFNWGEPLLNKKFPSFVQKAHKYDVWTTCSTNFSINISEEFLDLIILSGLDLLIVSVDGMTQETYTKYRIGGNLELVLSNLKKLVARKRILGSKTPNIRFQFLDFPWTHNQIEEARAIATEIGVNEFHVKEGCIHPPKKLVNLTRGQNAKQTFMNQDNKNNFIKLQQEKKDKFKFFGCDHLYHQLSINSDGSVHPCCYVYEPGHTVGNILDENDCFNNKIMQSSRSVFHSLHEENIYGYNPCVNCWILGDREAQGHKESTISFQPAFEMIVKEPLSHFINHHSPRGMFYLFNNWFKEKIAH